MAYDLDGKTNYTRGVAAPDGDYLITLAGEFWNALDWMNVESDWKEQHFIQLAWTCAKETQNDGTMNNPDNFAREFTDALRMAIGYQYQWIDHEEKGVVNAP